MATIVRSNLRDILLAIKAQLVLKLGITENRVLLARKKRGFPKLASDSDIVLCPHSPVPQPGQVKGAGRFGGTRLRPLGVLIRTRQMMDLPDRDDTWLTDSSNSHWAFEEDVLDTLEEFFPLDSQGNALTVEPLHQIPGGEPLDDPTTEDPSVGVSQLEFKILYYPDFSGV